MTRRLLTAAVLCTAAAYAAPVPKAPPPPAPKTSANLQLGTAKMNGELIQITQTVDQISYVMVQEVVDQNGQQVTVTKQVPQTRQVQQVYNMTLKGTKASTADGKEIAEEDLAKKLADSTAVVRCYQAFDPEWKKLFADDVIFLEPNNVGVVRPGFPGGGVRPLPAPLPPGGGFGGGIIIEKDVILPVPAPLPGEKK